MSARIGRYAQPLPVGPVEHRAPGWWGMWALIATEAALFAYLLFAYGYLASQSHAPWPPGELPKLTLALPNTLVLIASSLAFAWGERGLRRGDRMRLLVGLAGACVLGAVFAAVQLEEWKDKPFTYASDAYGSLYFTITGFHMAHVAVGLLVMLALLLWSAMGLFDRDRHAPVSIGALYWHFVDVVWLAVFATFYLLPRLR